MANRLEHEDSPYLQQHKNNPVDWYPWCDEAFERAAKENKAIFISIGYSSCHWCHVMEEKVFENEVCAEILNKHFISIKIDREERPDIDKHYQEVYQLLNQRSGGWPTSIFCTPQNQPFYAGTYIPPESEGGNVQGLGFRELTTIIAEKVAISDQKLYDTAAEVQNFLGQVKHPEQATVLKEEFVKNFMLQVKHNYQESTGGFSAAPKFPHASTLHTLINIDRLFSDDEASLMLLHTLNTMKKGGMYDLVDGGFCRYSVDEKWHVPHFEKMLYDNALLCDVYTKAYLTYNDEEYLDIAKECADFWHNFMSEDDLLYSASDADSEGAEGSYFIYSYEEVKTTLEQNGYENVDEILVTLGVTPTGNFEGKNIIRLKDGQRPEYFEEIRQLLQKLRQARPYPFIDKKIQTSWSAMMIRSLFRLGAIDAKYTERAQKNLVALLNTMYVDDTLYHTTLIHKSPKVKAFLEDYAFLGVTLIEAYKATQNELYLIRAQHFANVALEKFYNKGMWNFSVGEFTTKAETYDNTYTSSVSVMVDLLQSLGTLLEDEKYSHFAFKTLEYNSYELGRRPVLYPYMLDQTLRHLKSDYIIKSEESLLTNNTYELARINYPYIQLRSSSQEGFTICNDKSCFANTKDVQELDSLIANFL